MRRARTIITFTPGLDGRDDLILPLGIVPFPRGFAFGPDGRLFQASGMGPDGIGDNSIVAFAPDRQRLASFVVRDAELSPLDLAVAPNGNVLVSSEHPFGKADAVTTLREYSAADGYLVRVFRPDGLAKFRQPRGLLFGSEGRLYCVAQGEVVAFDFATGRCLGTTVRFPCQSAS